MTPTTPQQRAIDKDKKYAITRGDRYMVHRADGRRPYNGSDLAEAQRVLAEAPTNILTDLSKEPLTTAQLLIMEHVNNARRTNTRFVVVNKRSGKKMYAGNEQYAAAKTLSLSTSLECYDLQKET